MDDRVFAKVFSALAVLRAGKLRSRPFATETHMCVAIYIVLIGLFFFYSDYVIGQYVLTVNTGQQEAMVVAVGWEMVLWLWPVMVAAMVVASGISVWLTRRCRRCAPQERNGQ